MYGGPWMYPLSPAPYTAWSHEERGTTLEDPFERLFSLIRWRSRMTCFAASRPCSEVVAEATVSAGAPG